jgi:hypothetical protein
MAEKIVSPGVFTKENDLSFLQQGVADIGTAFVGPFKEGPLVPTIVNTQTEFEQLYGITDDTYYTPLAVQAYLKEAGAATICRVAGIGGYKEENPLLVSYASASVTKSVAILFNTDPETTSFATGITISGNTESAGLFVLSGSNLQGVFTASLNPEDADDIESVYGSNPRGNKEAYAYGYFAKAAGNLTYVSSSVFLTALPDQEFNFDACEAQTPYIQSQLISGERYNLFKFETMAGGNAANTKIKIGITNIKPAGTVPGTDYAVFTIVIRAFSDTNKKKAAIESYSNVTLDPNSPNYIYRVIGDRHITIGDDGKVTETGDWVNKSRYIRMVSVDRDASLAPELIPVTCTPWGHAPYKMPLSASLNLIGNIPAVTFVSASTTTYGGIDLDANTDNLFYLRAIPFPANPSYGNNVGYYLDNDGLQPIGVVAADVAKRNFLVAFQEGFDGMSPTIPINKGKDISATNTQGLNCALSTSSGSIAYGKMISALSNADEYDIQMIVTPGIVRAYHPSVVEDVINMVQEIRGDAFYIFEGTPALGSIAEAKDQAQAVDSNYAAMYYPWVKTVDVNTNKLITIPPSVLMPAVYAANDRIAAEWFAPAGLNRGGLGGAVAVLNKLTQADRDSLYEDKVNPICQFPGQGIVAFGQKTLQTKPSALDRINVRRLLLTVRKYIASTSRYLIFEQNSSTTRNRFLSIVNPYLEGIQQRQGLYAFKVIMDESNNTPDVIDRNFLKGAIYLQPTKTAEFIQIDFNILPTGAAFGG